MSEQLNHWERRLLGLVKKHGPLIEEHRDNEVIYFVQGFGQVGGRAPRSLIDRKILQPIGDGLFEGHTQTYAAAPEPGGQEQVA